MSLIGCPGLRARGEKMLLRTVIAACASSLGMPASVRTDISVSPLSTLMTCSTAAEKAESAWAVSAGRPANWAAREWAMDAAAAGGGAAGASAGLAVATTTGAAVTGAVVAGAVGAAATGTSGAGAAGAVAMGAGSGSGVASLSGKVGRRKYFCASCWSKSPMAGISVTGACQGMWKSGFVGPRDMASARKTAPEAIVRDARGDIRWAATRDLDRKDISPEVGGSVAPQPGAT